MQASKIKVGSTYAVRSNDELVRFTVTAVITRRDRNTGSPHDYSSSIEGFSVDVKDSGGKNTKFLVDTAAVLGPYEEQVELAERARLENERSAHEKQLKHDRAVLLYLSLYAKVGAAAPDPKSFNLRGSGPFRLTGTYSAPDRIEITEDGVSLLLASFGKMPA